MAHTTTRLDHERKLEAQRYVVDLCNVYLNVLRDVLYAYPNLEHDLSKDWSRLTSYAIARGLPFFMVDLPQAGKHLDRCLAAGEYTTSGLPCTNGAGRRVPIPNLFRGLYLLVFDVNGRLKEDADVCAILFLRQLLYLAKKAQYRCSDEAVHREVEEFLATDNLLPLPDPWWTREEADSTQGADVFKGFAQSPYYAKKILEAPPGDEAVRTEIHRNRESLLAMLDQTSRMVALTLGLYDPLEWRFSHGPGAVSNAKAGSNRYRFVNWPERLESVFSYADCAFHDWRSWIAASFNRVWGMLHYGRDAVEVVSCASDIVPSLLLNVPKTLTKPRLIAEEPYEHMWCQQNIWHYMRTRVSRTWIGKFVNFDDQSLNRELARKGSLDGSLATIDLSSASDRVSCECVGNMFRANQGLLHALRACRTHVIEVEKSTVELRKFSTMGSSCTFPVQSLVFLSVALAGTLWTRGSKGPLAVDRANSPEEEMLTCAGQVAVFGDDIIVPTEAVPAVRDLLEVLDFKINASKTFTIGNFRESCGADCFRGELVAPAYWHGPSLKTPESYASTVEVSNNFYQRLLVNTAEYLRTELDRHWKVPVVPFRSGVLGAKSFVTPSKPNAATRWNKRSQCWECKLITVKAVSDITSVQDDSALLQFFTEQPDPLTKWEAGVRSRAVVNVSHRWVPFAVAGYAEGSDRNPYRPCASPELQPLTGSWLVIGRTWSPRLTSCNTVEYVSAPPSLDSEWIL
jgi:hypothetical protein